jgi:hypothetical protein
MIKKTLASAAILAISMGTTFQAQADFGLIWYGCYDTINDVAVFSGTTSSGSVVSQKEAECKSVRGRTFLAARKIQY